MELYRCDCNLAMMGTEVKTLPSWAANNFFLVRAAELGVYGNAEKAYVPKPKVKRLYVPSAKSKHYYPPLMKLKVKVVPLLYDLKGNGVALILILQKNGVRLVPLIRTYGFLGLVMLHIWLL